MHETYSDLKNSSCVIICIISYILPTLKAPWNSMTFTASDTGTSIKGKHVSVYIGEGKAVQASGPVEHNNNNLDVKVCYF